MKLSFVNSIPEKSPLTLLELFSSLHLFLSWLAAVGMPKKFQGENSKAATARARKAEAKAVADARKKKEEEDALWQETDKHVLKKEQRKVRTFPDRWCLLFLLVHSWVCMLWCTCWWIFCVGAGFYWCGLINNICTNAEMKIVESLIKWLCLQILKVTKL